MSGGRLNFYNAAGGDRFAVDLFDRHRLPDLKPDPKRVVGFFPCQVVSVLVQGDVA